MKGIPGQRVSAVAVLAVAGARSAFSITDSDIAKLPGWVRYNLLRHELGRSLAAAAGKPDERTNALRRFLGGVDALDDPYFRVAAPCDAARS